MTVATGALQTALAAEYAIVYGYGVVGGQLSGRQQAIAAAALQEHQVRRDAIIALLAAQHLTPVAADPAYSLPFPVTDTAGARRLAVELETRGAGSAWDLVAATGATTPARSLAIDWITAAARRIDEWGAAVPALPGQPT